MRKEIMEQLKIDQTGTCNTGLTNTLKEAVGKAVATTNKGGKLFVTVSFLLFLLAPLSSAKATAIATVQTANQADLSVNQEALAVNQEVQAVNQAVQVVNQESLVVNQEVQAVNQEVQAVNQETLSVNQEDLSVNQTVQAVNQEDLSVNQDVQTTQTTHKEKEAPSLHKDIQNLFAKQLKTSFKQTTFTNLEPAPIKHWYQAEVNNQVVYFNPTQSLLFLGEVYTNNGISLSEQTRNKWQSRKAANLDVSAALVIGTGQIEIIEFMDTDCPFCQRFNDWISAINNAYKDKHNKDLFTRKIVLTPIGQLHPSAYKEAVHILCQSPENYETVIRQTLESKVPFSEMDSCKKGRALLIEHRKIAQALGVSATPTLVINGQIIQGFNQQKIKAIIKQQLNQKTKARQTKAK